MEVVTKEKKNNRKRSSLVGKIKVCDLKAVPRYGESVNRQVDKRGEREQKHKKYFYRTALNTCLSFLNEVKNLAKDTGIKYGFCD